MRLIRATTAIRRYWDPEDAPDYRTVLAAVKRGDIPGKVWSNGGREQVWVDADYFEPTGGGTGSKLADKILERLKPPAQGLSRPSLPPIVPRAPRGIPASS